MREENKPHKIYNLLLVLLAMAGVVSLAYALSPIFDTSVRVDAPSSKPSLGQIESIKNDARYKSSESFVWYQTKESQGIHVGDSVFAGADSSAQVKLEKGGDVSVGSNSLVVFSEIKEQKLANLMQGSFRLSVKGEAKFAIRGKVTKIATSGTGKKSDVQIYTGSDNQPKLKVISGEATIQLDESKPPVVITENQIIDIPAPSQEEIASMPVEVIAPVIEPPPPMIPTPESSAESVKYFWKFSDAFSQKANGLIENDLSQSQASGKFLARWRSDNGQNLKGSFVQLAEDSDFANAKTFEASRGSFEFTKLDAKTYFWRVSDDQSHWSQAQKFKVETDFLAVAPDITTLSDTLSLVGQSAVAKLTLSHPEVRRGILAISKSKSFPASQTTYQEFQGTNVEAPFTEVGTYFAKARAINSQDEITEWSSILKIKVQRPELLPPPKLLSRDIEISDGENLEVSWKPVAGARGYQVMLGADLSEAQAFQVGSGVKWTLPNDSNLPESGNFWVQARDEWGRLGEKAKGRFTVKEKPLPIRSVASSEEVEQPLQGPAPAPTIAPEKSALESASEALARFWVWAGFGANYSSFSQDVTSVQNIEVAGFKSPSTVFRAGVWVSDHLGVDLGFKQTPGQINGAPGFTVTGGNFTWQTLSGELLYMANDQRLAKAPSEFNLRAGFQVHQMPFLIQTSGDSLAVTQVDVQTITLGFEYKKQFIPKTRFEWMMRYQQPFGSNGLAGENYDVAAKLVFDGSVGIVREVYPNFHLGTYWYGQWHNYRFDYVNQANSRLNLSGSQSLFYSTIDLRLGWEF